MALPLLLPLVAALGAGSLRLRETSKFPASAMLDARSDGKGEVILARCSSAAKQMM